MSDAPPKKEGAPEKNSRPPRKKKPVGEASESGASGDAAAAPPTVGERGGTTTMDADRLQAKKEGGSTDKPERAKPEPKEPKGPPGALSGEVKWYQRKKGFGFIAPADGGEEVFLHLSGLNVSSVDAGEKVTYDTEKDEEGKVKAVNVSVVGERKPKPKKRASAAADEAAAEGGDAAATAAKSKPKPKKRASAAADEAVAEGGNAAATAAKSKPKPKKRASAAADEAAAEGSDAAATADKSDKSADAPTVARRDRTTTMEADRLAAKLDGGAGKEKLDRKDRKDNGVISQMVHLTNFSGRYVKSKDGGDADVAEACIWAQCCPFRRPFWRGQGMGKRVLTISPKMLTGADATRSSWKLWYVNKTPGKNEKHVFHKMVLAPASRDFEAQGWEAFEGTVELGADDSKLPQEMFDKIRAKCPEEEGFFEHLHVGLVVESIDTTLR